MDKLICNKSLSKCSFVISGICLLLFIQYYHGLLLPHSPFSLITADQTLSADRGAVTVETEASLSRPQLQAPVRWHLVASGLTQVYTDLQLSVCRSQETGKKGHLCIKVKFSPKPLPCSMVHREVSEPLSCQMNTSHSPPYFFGHWLSIIMLIMDLGLVFYLCFLFFIPCC